MFIFKKCSYEELQAVQHREDLLLSGWTLLEKEYMPQKSWPFQQLYLLTEMAIL